jgi:hypothetical protein
MQLEFTDLHEKAVLLQILLSGRIPFGHHRHIGRENLSKILLAFLPFLSGQPILKHNIMQDFNKKILLTFSFIIKEVVESGLCYLLCSSNVKKEH